MPKELIRFIALLIMAFFGYLIYKISEMHTDNQLEILNNEYPQLLWEQKLDAKVIEIMVNPEGFNNDPLHAYIMLTDSIKIRLRTGFELNSKRTLDDILNINQIIRKTKDTNRITILDINSDTSIFYFELRDDNGYPMKK